MVGIVVLGKVQKNGSRFKDGEFVPGLVDDSGNAAVGVDSKNNNVAM
jgi:hypothetical protein